MQLSKIAESVTLLAENYSFEVTDSYLKLLQFSFNQHEVEEPELQKAVGYFLGDVSKEEWNKRFGYNSKPAIADWLDAMRGRRGKLSAQQEAEYEVGRLISEVGGGYFSSKCGFITDNPVTNAAIKKLGGIGDIAWKLDQTNPSYKNDAKTWLKKELISMWLICHTREEKCYDPTYRNGGSDLMIKIGSPEKCNLMLSGQKVEKLQFEAGV